MTYSHLNPKIKVHVAIGKENHTVSEIAGTWPLRPKCGVTPSPSEFFKTEADIRHEWCEPCVECFSGEEFALFLLGNV